MLIRPNLSPADNRRIQAMLRANNNSGNLRQQLLDGSPLYLPLTHTAIPTRGSVTPAFTRATTETGQKWDEAGYLDFTALAGEIVFKGARRVRNLVATTSEVVTNAAWVKTASGGPAIPSVDATAISGPLGTLNGYVVTFPAVSGVAKYSVLGLPVFTAVAGNKYVPSIYLRNRGGASTMFLYGYWGGYSHVTAISITTGWTRIEVPAAAISAPGAGAFYIGCDTSNAGMAAGMAAQVIDVAMGQAEDVTGQTTQTASEYVSVGVESAPAYHGSMVDGVKCYDTDRSGNPISTSGSYPLVGYVPWEARTNLQTYSNDFTNAVWNNEVARTVITAAAGTSPSAANDAWSLIPTSNNNAHRVYNPAIVNPSGTFTISLWAKTIGGYNLTLTDTGGLWQADFDLTNGTVATPTTGESLAARIEAWPNGWYRCSATVTSASGNFPLQWITDANKTLSYAGNTTSGVYWYGYQLELGSFASPYIPTTTVAVARNASVLTYTGADVANIKTLMIGVTPRVAGVNDVFIVASLSGAAANKQMYFDKESPLSYGSLYVRDTTDQAFVNIGTYIAGAKNKVAGRFSTNNFAGCINGGTVGTDTSGTKPAVTQLNVGTDIAASIFINSPVGPLYGWTSRELSDSELRVITT